MNLRGTLSSVCLCMEYHCGHHFPDSMFFCFFSPKLIVCCLICFQIVPMCKQFRETLGFGYIALVNLGSIEHHNVTFQLKQTDSIHHWSKLRDISCSLSFICSLLPGSRLFVPQSQVSILCWCILNSHRAHCECNSIDQSSFNPTNKAQDLHCVLSNQLQQ